jgi:endonuclease/exonuclease/phosphatase family metal-dependent hydrolase
MRLATFNIENLDLEPDAGMPLEARIGVLRPILERIAADILCLQEVNGQHVPGIPERRLVALEQLLDGTRYAGFARAATTGPSGQGAASVHNLVILSRYPIREEHEVRHRLVEPLRHHYLTGLAKGGGPQEIPFDRPLLVAVVELPGGRRLDVVNLHLRASRASAVPGEKLTSEQWRSARGWAEGCFLSAFKRTAQALELRLLVDERLDEDPERLIAVAGDFNAEDHETPLRLLAAAPEETGNAGLAARSLLVLDRAIPVERRWSVRHRDRREMLDHIVASRALARHLRTVEVLNETVADAASGAAQAGIAGSSHAPVVAELALD